MIYTNKDTQVYFPKISINSGIFRADIKESEINTDYKNFISQSYCEDKFIKLCIVLCKYKVPIIVATMNSIQRTNQP